MKIKDQKQFEQLIGDAQKQEFSGWDFGFIADRWQEKPTSWSYEEIVRNHIKPEIHMLDMDTGGGEMLSSLQPLPRYTYATEGYPPNVPVAKSRLEPLGVEVVSLYGDDPFPFKNGLFDLVTNRHAAFIPPELHRVLKPGGYFITQQVGGKNNFEINELLQDKPEFRFSYWTPDLAAKQISDAGFQILDQKEEFPETTFTDIGALVIYLRIISWQIDDFSVEKYYDKLVKVHNLMQEKGRLQVKGHRFLVIAQK